MAIDLTTAKLAELRQKAEAAEKESPSPWHGGPDGDRWVLVDSHRGVFHTICEERNIADFIAHADPATVLALVEEIERLQEQNCQFRLKLYIEELVGKPESEAGQ